MRSVNTERFFPKRWESGCIKVNPGTAARVRVSRCGSMWRGGGRRPAGSAGWPEISPRSVARYHLNFHLSTTSIPTGLPRAERCMIDFQSISERKWCKLQDFRLFTIGKVIIRRFSKHKWANMMQNVGFPRIYYCKSDHWSIFKAWVSENDAKWEIFAVLLLQKWALADFQSISERK